jgi:hypothetical protein
VPARATPVASDVNGEIPAVVLQTAVQREPSE